MAKEKKKEQMPTPKKKKGPCLKRGECPGCDGGSSCACAE
jgi:hypothetical protein